MAAGKNLYVANLFARFFADTSHFDKEMGKANARLRRSAEDLTQMGRALSMTVTAPIVAAGAASAKMAMDFEASMTKIITLVGIGREAVESWGPAVRDMAGLVGVSAGKLADALFYITSAGIRGKESLEVLEASAKASAIGMGEVKEVAYASVSAMNAYGQSNLTAEKAVATLIRTVRMGNMEARSLPMAFGRVLPVAAELGVSFQDVGASIAMMTRAGVTARLAAFALRSTLMTMVAPTHESKEAMHELGLTWAEMRRTAKEEGLLVALKEIYDATNGNMEAFQAAIPNARAFIGALQLVGKNASYSADVFEHLADTVEEDVNETFEEWSKTAQANLKKAFAELSEAAVSFGSSLMGVTTAMKAMATALSTAMKAYYMMPKSLKLLTIAAAAFFAVLGPGIFVIGQLTRVKAALASQLGILNAAMVRAGVSQDILTSKIALAQVATMKLRMSQKGLRLEMMKGNAKIGTGITNLKGWKGAAAGAGAAAAVVATALAAWDLGRWISDITGLTKATSTMPPEVDRFTKSLEENEEVFNRTQEMLVGVAAELKHQKLEWLMNAEQSKYAAREMAKLYPILMEQVHARRLEADAIANMTEAEKHHLSYMSQEQQVIRELTQMRAARNKELREEYDLMTGPEIRTAVRQLSAEFENLKSQGLPLQDIWVAMRSRIEEAISAQYRLGESATQDWRDIARALEENGIAALDKFIDKLDNGVGKSVEDFKGLMNESYDVWTRQDVGDRLDGLVEDFKRMKAEGIPMKRIWEEMRSNIEEAYGWAYDYGMQLPEPIKAMNQEFKKNGVDAIDEWATKFDSLVPEHVDVTGGKIIDGMVKIGDKVVDTLAGGFDRGFAEGMNKWTAYDKQLEGALNAELSGGFGKGFDQARTEYDQFTRDIRAQPIVVTAVPDYDAFWNALQDIIDGKVPDAGG